MDYQSLQREASVYQGALRIEKLISGTHVHTLEKCLRILTMLFFLAWVGVSIFPSVSFLTNLFPGGSDFAATFSPFIRSVLYLVCGLWAIAALGYAFFASFYFKDSDSVLPEVGMVVPPIRFEVAEVVLRGYNEPIVDFFSSRCGRITAMRLGLTNADLSTFLQSRVPSTHTFHLVQDEGRAVGLEQLAKALFSFDEGLQHFLALKKLDAADFTGAADWVSRMEEEYKEYLRWWSKDTLGRIPGIGKDWAYGEIPLLRRYAIPLMLHPGFSSSKGTFGKSEAVEIERVLSRGRESNVLLVGEEGVPKLAPLARLARKINSGVVLPPLAHKQMYIFDGVPFLTAMKEKALFETELVRLLSETARAGNIIFIFDNFEKFYQEAKLLNSDVLALLDPFLTVASIQIVAIVELGAFRQVFEGNPKIRERFEHVLITGAGVSGSIPLVEDEALRSEVKSRVFFTYPALRTVTESAERYFFEGIMPDKAIDLLLELVPKIKASGKSVIVREDVLELISEKTGIAVSEAKGEERTKLLKLEETLHERIVGQDEAVKAISGALRRARSGISSPNRPMGSFLFLGPTGVGKTETTKALAQVFFGDEKSVIRLDMSEYQSEDALPRLIGTFESGRPGILASLLREHPYGVLLLDEFEKTNKQVHDLFLQILDEGFFTDVVGKRVNARNLIVIATSNAGSDVIWKAEQEGKELSKDIVLTEIINRAIFKPELLNRFDGVVLFHSLTKQDVRTIARLQLKKLAVRLKEKGLEFVITDALLDYLVSVGQDPKFGARPMNRAIQEKVEQVIAEKMLRGEIGAGSKVELTGAELT